MTSDAEKTFDKALTGDHGYPFKTGFGLEEMRPWCFDAGKILMVGMLVPPRPGVVLFTVRTEYNLYRPNTPLNKKFEYAMALWEQVMWCVCVCPSSDRKKIERIARGCGLVLVRGHPSFLHGKEFPLRGPQVYTLENRGPKIAPAEERKLIDDIYIQNGVTPPKPLF